MPRARIPGINSRLSWRDFGRWLLCAALSLACILPANAAIAAKGSYGFDLSGKPVTRLTSNQTKAVVLLFLATDCPISNRYLPQIKQLENAFAPQHVAFWVVYPNPGDTASVIRQHQREYGTNGEEIRDPNHTLVELAHARITPEAAVLVPAGEGLREVYAGRIDNRYIDLGQQRPRATEHDLRDAIAAVLRGSKIRRPAGPPVGCFIVNQP